jgi:hypothetical protein
MGGVSISDPQAQGLEGVSFSGALDGVERRFIAMREGLEDLEYAMLESAEAMLAAFQRQQAQVALVAARALQSAGPGDGPIVLQSLL